jgi:hypothetical protein
MVALLRLFEPALPDNPTWQAYVHQFQTPRRRKNWLLEWTWRREAQEDLISRF